MRIFMKIKLYEARFSERRPSLVKGGVENHGSCGLARKCRVLRTLLRHFYQRGGNAIIGNNFLLLSSKLREGGN